METTQDLIVDDISPELLEKIKKLFREEGLDWDRKCRIETVIETPIVGPDDDGEGELIFYFIYFNLF